MNHAAQPRWTRHEREAIASYLREVASDTHLLLSLSEASMCADVAAILRGTALRLEQPTPPATAPPSQPVYTSIPNRPHPLQGVGPCPPGRQRGV